MNNPQYTSADSYFVSDKAFEEVYPAAIRALAYRHWTPLDVAKKAADFLVTGNDTRVLDIGSGVGKFCLAAAHYKPAASFIGVEQRAVLVQHAIAAKKIVGISNADFLTGNFTGIDFTQYNHFYLYNPFYENLAGTPKIDDSLPYSNELFEQYNAHLCRQMTKLPAGTRLATFHIIEEELIPNYHVVGSDFEDSLKYWVKL